MPLDPATDAASDGQLVAFGDTQSLDDILCQDGAERIAHCPVPSRGTAPCAAYDLGCVEVLQAPPAPGLGALTVPVKFLHIAGRDCTNHAQFDGAGFLDDFEASSRAHAKAAPQSRGRHHLVFG